MKIGKTLKSLMKEKGFTAASLSEASGVSVNTIRSLIQRDASRVDIQILLDICNALQISPEYFYADYYRDKPETIPSEWGALRAILDSVDDEELKLIEEFVSYLQYRRKMKQNKNADD